MSVQTVRSTDGTTLAVERTGTGPVLVLVPGAFCDRTTTRRLAELLAPHLTIVAYDRRGRGASGDTAPYAVAREVEDLQTVVAAAGGTAYAYGHSSGGSLVLEAAAAGVELTRLAVYEPPYTAQDDGTGGPVHLLATIRALVASGDLDEAAATFMADTGMPPDMVSATRAGPDWPRLRDLAPTLVYDLELGNGGVVPRERLAGISAPTLVMAGGDGPEWAHRAAAAISSAMPHARRLTVRGQPHGVSQDAVAPLLLAHFSAPGH